MEWQSLALFAVSTGLHLLAIFCAMVVGHKICDDKTADTPETIGCLVFIGLLLVAALVVGGAA